MASILSLPNECLHIIVSFIDDPSSFKSVTLTCKRFRHVTENTRSILHTNLLRAKAENLIKCCIVEWRGKMYFDSSSEQWHERNTKYDGRDLVQLLRDCASLTAAKNALTYDKVVRVWKRKGPVAAKLFTWVRHLKRDFERDSTSFIKVRNLTLHFPSGDRSMHIHTWHRGDYGREYVGMHVSCGDFNVKADDLPSRFTKEEIKLAMKPMKAIVGLLQKELGETVPLISDFFFFWLCFSFPYKSSNLLEDNRLKFKDAARNAKPSHASVQTAIDGFHKEFKFEDSLEELLTIWNGKIINEWFQPENSKKEITETVRLLSQRSETKVLKRLREDASRFYDIVNQNDLKKLSNQVLLDLFLRTTLEASSFKPATNPSKYVKSRVFFKCAGKKVMKVCGSIHGDGTRYPNWEKLELEFTLPDEKVLKLESPLDLRVLDPVTDLLHEGFNQIRHAKQSIPKMSNFLTSVYFIRALNFSEAYFIAFDSFDRLLLLTRYPESEEEWGYPESPEYYRERDEFS